MKLLYLTNVQIPAENAQNLQIQSMSRAFFDALKENFLLISPWNEKNKTMDNSYPWKKIKIPQQLPRPIRQLIFILKTRKTVYDFCPDVIYTRDIAIAWFFRMFGFKTIYEIHKPFETTIGNMIFKMMAKKIKIVAISQSLKDFIIEKYNLNADDILVAHDGVDLQHFNLLENRIQLRKKYFGDLANNFIVLYSGSLQAGKGVDLIIKSAKDLPEICFVIIGGSQNEIDAFKDVSPNIYFLVRMPQKQVPAFLKAADLLILPMNKNLSYGAYSSPLKLFEYMASETPILASDFGAIREVLNEENAFLFDPDNVNDLVEKIKYIRDNNEKARKIAKESFKLAKEYSWQKRADKIKFFINL